MAILSKENRELVNLIDGLQLEAILEHYGHKVVTYYADHKRGPSYWYIGSIDGVNYYGDIHGARQRAVEIINENTDPETGVLRW